MTMWTVTQTNRFHAAVAGAGIANWQSYYGQNLIGQWMIPFFGASVYDDPAVYEKSSPIHFIKNVKTPTLVIVGERDAECPASQSYEFWHALKTLGVPTQLIIYPGEGHLFIEPKASGRSIGSDRGMVRQILEVTLFSSGSFVVWHSRRFDTAEDSTEMACERDHYQREQSHCEISDTRRKAFRAEARTHPGKNEHEQSGSKRADHMQP